MPAAYQLVPKHRYPHQETFVNDNSEVTPSYALAAGITAFLCVFNSPKGRDNVVYTPENGVSGLVKEYGMGAFATYGQPLLNAYAAASTGHALVHCMRVSAPDSTYAVSNLMAGYKVEDDMMTVKFINKGADTPLRNLQDLEDCAAVPPTVDTDGFTMVKLFSMAYIGRGSWGRNLRWRVTSDKTADKSNPYKNYVFGLYSSETGLDLAEQFSVVFNEDAMYSGSSLAADEIVNTGSELITLLTNTDGFRTLYEAYKGMNADTTLTFEDFDPLLGVDKYTKLAIDKYTIMPEPVDGTTDPIISVASTTGVALIGGSDGAFAVTADKVARQAALDKAYLEAFSAETQPLIKSKNRYPTTFIMDANYPIECKRAIASLAATRTDCVAILDCGLGITTKASVKDYINTNLASYVNHWVHSIEPYVMKVRDPVTQKAITVTSTYWMCIAYPNHIFLHNGKHRPMAGNNYGIITGYLRNSVYPVFDEDLDSEIMDELADMHVNFAKVNATQNICRAMQETRQPKQSNLSELNNVLILLDVKRDCERLCAMFEYDFSEASDIARFNAAATTISDRYAAGQVRSITAVFDKNAWEGERGILHMYVTIVHKDLVKTTLIEIDVNRS